MNDDLYFQAGSLLPPDLGEPLDEDTGLSPGMLVGESPPPWRDQDIPPDPDAHYKLLLWRFRDEVLWP